MRDDLGSSLLAHRVVHMSLQCMDGHEYPTGWISINMHTFSHACVFVTHFDKDHSRLRRFKTGSNRWLFGYCVNVFDGSK